MSRLSSLMHLALPTAVASALLLTACGNNPTNTTDTQGNATSDTSNIDPNVLADTQAITINNGAEVESLDPHKISGVPEANLVRQMLVGLTTTDPDGKTIPGMASEWSSEDNKVWTFKLRDAKWSNGDAVTANDFVYSFRRVVDPATASPYASYLADVKVINAQDIIDGKAKIDSLGVTAIDDKTLQISLSEPVPYLPDTLFHSSVAPVHQKTVETFDTKWTDPNNIVVNGAYKLKEWKVNDKVVLERNPNYYDNDNTKIDTATFLPIPKATTDVARYKAGEIDMTEKSLPPEQFNQLKAEFGSQVHISPSLCTYYYEFNTVKPPFNDVRVRRALALALDRNTITDKVLAQGQTPAYQFTPPATNGNVKFSPDWETWDQDKRVQEAKKLLAEAGYSDGNPLTFELLYNTSENHKKIAVAAASLWKEALGPVDVTLTNQEWKTYLDARREGNYQIARAGWCGDYNEASTFLNILKSGNTNNHGKYSSQTFDNIMTKTLASGVNDADRTQLYNQAEAQLDTDMPLLQVYHYVNPRMIKPYVIGFTGNDALDNWQIKDMSIAKH